MNQERVSEEPIAAKVQPPPAPPRGGSGISRKAEPPPSLQFEVTGKDHADCEDRAIAVAITYFGDTGFKLRQIDGRVNWITQSTASQTRNTIQSFRTEWLATQKRD